MQGGRCQKTSHQDSAQETLNESGNNNDCNLPGKQQRNIREQHG